VTDPAFADAAPDDKANPSRLSWEEADYLDQQRRRLPTVRFRRLHLNLPGFPDGGAFDAVKLDAAVARGVRVRPPEPAIKYAAYVDMSGGSSDAAVLAIGHREGTVRVVDVVMDQGTKPPFDPKQAIPRFARILGEYRAGAVWCDTYGRKAPTLAFETAFAACGIAYHPSPFSAGELYELMEVPLNSAELVLPDDPETLEQFAGLQRRGIRIDHRAGEHDDRANAVAGLCWLLGQDAGPLDPKRDIHLGPQRVSVAGPMSYGSGRQADQSWFDSVQEDREAGGAFSKGRRWAPDW
jgi:hypothetical protein